MQTIFSLLILQFCGGKATRYMYNIKAAAPPACTRDLEAKSMKRAKAHKMDAIFLSVFFSKCNYIACEHERDAIYT